jgi:hypothetical protein
VQLSRAGEFYPGTSERVLLLSGPLHSVLTAVFLSLEKLPRDPGSPVARGSAGSSGRGGRDDAVGLQERCPLDFGRLASIVSAAVQLLRQGGLQKRPAAPNAAAAAR